MRACFIISFDLAQGRTYSRLISAIKAYGTWARITQSTYAIVTDSTATEIRDFLTQHIKPTDRLFVIKSGGSAAWRNSIADREWLKKYLSLNLSGY